MFLASRCDNNEDDSEEDGGGELDPSQNSELGTNTAEHQFLEGPDFAEAGGTN